MASVVSLGGQVVQASLPQDLTKDAFSNRSDSTLFRETTVQLQRPLAVDIGRPTTVPVTFKTVTSGSVPAGTWVTSWYIHTDPGPETDPPRYTHYTGAVTFDAPVLGIIYQSGSLAASDSVLGVPGTSYPAPGIAAQGDDQRGLELTGLTFSDSVELDNANTVSWSLNTNLYTDDFRIITAANPVRVGSVRALIPQGYRLVGSDGGVFSFGRGFYGSTGGLRLDAPIVGASATPDQRGYYLVGSDGGVFTYGDAVFHGSTGSITLARPVVGMAVTPSGGGYYLFARDGGVFAFGRAPFDGSLGGVKLEKPVVGGASNPLGAGYWEVASDGGVFAFGAPYFGSMGGEHLSEPVVAMAPTPDGQGYWLVASDGGVFSFGDAGFYGSTGGLHLSQPIVAMIPTPSGKGYWLLARDGGVFSFGDADFLGSLGGVELSAPIAAGM